MRKLIVCNIMSLDGYYEGANKNVMDLFSYKEGLYPDDESFDEYNAERLKAADTVLLGKITYELLKGYWPAVPQDPKAPPVEREISRLMDDVEKVVISDSLTSEETIPYLNTEIIKRKQSLEYIKELKQKAGKDILIFGSLTLWNELIEHHLIDELHLMICPVTLNAGTKLFTYQSSDLFQLIDTRTWTNSGNVLVRYRTR